MHRRAHRILPRSDRRTAIQMPTAIASNTQRCNPGERLGWASAQWRSSSADRCKFNWSIKNPLNALATKACAKSWQNDFWRSRKTNFRRYSKIEPSNYSQNHSNASEHSWFRQFCTVLNVSEPFCFVLFSSDQNWSVRISSDQFHRWLMIYWQARWRLP